MLTEDRVKPLLIIDSVAPLKHAVCSSLISWLSVSMSSTVWGHQLSLKYT